MESNAQTHFFPNWQPRCRQLDPTKDIQKEIGSQKHCEPNSTNKLSNWKFPELKQ